MNILIVDDHAIVRAGLRRLLATLPNTTVGEAATGRDALAACREARVDIVLLDINLPDSSGLEVLGRLLLLDKTIRVIVFSMHTDVIYASRALRAGALGYLSKNAAPDEILAAVRKVSEGGRYVENEIAQELALQPTPGSDPMAQLSERDLDILRLLGEGRSLAEIAQALGVGYKTIANTSSQIKNKLGVTRTADLIRLSIEMGIAR
jgi:DNA-binding NarL/FixJ family response regulator